MEDEKKIVKVYSNNSKKSRLKRNKNKFQRIWDAEKQTYIKVRKTKYPKKQVISKKDWRNKISEKAIERRQNTPKTKKTVATVKQMETKVTPIKNNKIKTPARKETTTKIHGINYTWDTKNLRYKRAA